MPRLDALPSIDIIHGFKGVLDFYLWKGLPCVRSWPHTPRHRRTEGTIAAAELFGAIIKGYNLLGEGPLEQFRADAADNTRTARDIYVSAVLGHLHQRTEPPPPPPPEEEMYDAYVCLRDVKAQNTSGGTFTSGAWRTRDLNDEQADPEDICSLVANQFTLPAGTYRCMISCPAYRVNLHQARLYNVTDSALLLLGTVQRTHNSYYTGNRAFIAGRFTVAAGKLLEVQHQSTSTQATWGFGYRGNITDEIYTLVELWREIEAE